MPNASISTFIVSNSAFCRAYASLPTFDAIGGAIARTRHGAQTSDRSGRPAAPAQGRCLRSAHCPHCVFSPLFSRGDIDRRAFQRAPPPSATGVREAPPKSATDQESRKKSPGFGAFSSSPYTVPLCWVWGPGIAVLWSCHQRVVSRSQVATGRTYGG